MRAVKIDEGRRFTMNESRTGEAGWSLPILWIMLILIIAVVFLFFGTLRWIGLGILGIFALLVTFVAISTLLDKEEEKKPRKRRKRRRRPTETAEIEVDEKPTTPAPRKADFFAGGVGNLKYVDCAVATDGGSLALVLSDDQERSFSLVLDRALGTETYERIRYQGKELLSYEEETALLPKLHMLVHGDKDAVQDIIGTFTGIIETRS